MNSKLHNDAAVERAGGSIRVEDMRVTRGTFTLRVDELSIEAGEIFALLGQTGAGKTVLMESIAGAYPIESGAVYIDNEDMSEIPVQNRGLGILYQDYALFPHLTVEKNIAYGLHRAHVSRSEIDERVNEMLELFEITHIADRHPGVISGGESQRTALARALIMNPRVLILDEPFSAVDPITKQRMYDMLRAVHRRFGCTIVFVTHDFQEAQMLANRIGIILSGKLRTVVPAENLFDDIHDDDVSAFLGIREQNAKNIRIAACKKVKREKQTARYSSLLQSSSFCSVSTER